MLSAPEISVFAQFSHLFMSQILIREPRVKSTVVKYPPTSLLNSLIYSHCLLGPNTTTLDYLLNKI
jgi:hypothetical protein